MHFCDVIDFRLNDVIDSESDSFSLNIRHCYSRKSQSQQGVPRKATLLLHTKDAYDQQAIRPQRQESQVQDAPQARRGYSRLASCDIKRSQKKL